MSTQHADLFVCVPEQDLDFEGYEVRTEDDEDQFFSVTASTASNDLPSQRWVDGAVRVDAHRFEVTAHNAPVLAAALLALSGSHARVLNLDELPLASFLRLPSSSDAPINSDVFVRENDAATRPITQDTNMEIIIEEESDEQLWWQVRSRLATLMVRENARPSAGTASKNMLILLHAMSLYAAQPGSGEVWWHDLSPEIQQEWLAKASVDLTAER